jgi:hypothetical protein
MMKNTIRTLALLLALAMGNPAMAIEEPEYTVLATASAYEVRQYQPYIVAEVDIRGESADSKGFRTLAGYIFGDNKTEEKMQMTAPVESRKAQESEGITYSFVMESRYTLDTLPGPNNENIRIREKPERYVAVRRFSGRWSEANMAQNERELLEALSADGIEPQGAIELARYNGPFTPWFMRRNELIVPIDWPPTTP